VPRISIEDRIDIEELVTEYAWLLDHQRWGEVSALCTDDAVLHIRGREIVGQDGLKEWAEYRAMKKNRRTQHQMTLLRLDAVTNDHVRGSCGLVLHTAKAGGGTYVDLVGEYQDEYVGGWKFQARRLVRLEES